MAIQINETTVIDDSRVLQNLGSALSVSNGGTGAASLTANYVLLGNGTSALQAVAPGSSGNVLTSNGTTWTSAAAAAGGFSNMAVFTSSGTWTVPSGITKCMVICTGAGGGTNYPGRESGGGAGATVIRTYTLSGGSATVTVAAGGTGDGGSSLFAYSATTITAGGGQGRAGGTRTGGIGGTPGNGEINIYGGGGMAADGSVGGNGGASYWGGGGMTSEAQGSNGQAFGGGAGGPGLYGNASYNGANGIVVIYY